MLRPLRGRLRAVERLPGYRLAYRHAERLVAVLIHFVGKVQHRHVELYAESLAHVGKTVKEIGVLALRNGWALRHGASPRSL